MMTDCLAPQRSESDYFLLENWTQRTQTRTIVRMNAYDCLSLLPLLTSYHTQVFEETVKLNLNLTCKCLPISRPGASRCMSFLWLVIG